MLHIKVFRKKVFEGGKESEVDSVNASGGRRHENDKKKVFDAKNHHVLYTFMHTTFSHKCCGSVSYKVLTRKSLHGNTVGFDHTKA